MLIKLEQVTKFYKQKEKIYPLKDIDLCIKAGDWVSVTGPSGSGKTTLLNIIGCLLRPSSGQVIFGGIDTKNLSDKELTEIRNRKIGFIFQGSYLMPSLNLLENILTPVFFTSLNRKEKLDKKEKAKDLLIQLGLGDRANSLPHQLSLGQRRRVAIARALINDPQILLADEPTNDLDSHRAKQIADILKQLNQKGITILMVTHQSDFAAQAGRSFKILEGRLEPS